jgi:UDP-glucose 4-epimerase
MWCFPTDAIWSYGGGRRIENWANSVKIGVTGASGFLGSTLTRHLADAGHELLALERTLPPAGEGAHPGVSWVQGDLASPHDTAAFVADAEAIIHLAWANTPLTSNAHLPSDVTANMLPTLTLLEAVREAATRPHIVFASSGGTVYGPPRDKRPFREGDDCRPQSSYGIQKLTVEQYLRMGSEHGWLTATALRIGNPYGVLLPPERLQGFIGTAVSQLRAGTPIRVFGNPANVRDYLHLTDMCRAFELALTPRELFDVLNIGSGTAHSVENVLRLIEELEGRPVAVQSESPADADELPCWVVLDVSKAREKLGWTPEITLRDGLSRLLSSPVPSGRAASAPE